MGRPENFYLNEDTKYPSGRVRHVQRIMRREYGNENHEGVDAHFEFDYMGSSEFEWGALPKALDEMRAMKKLFRKLPDVVPLTVKPIELQLTVGDLADAKMDDGAFTAHYFGPAEFVDRVREFFRRELQKCNGEDYPCLKEQTEIVRAYGTGKDRSGRGSRTIGWWDIENHWVMFMAEEDANKWRAAVMKKPKKKAVS